jgi:hypothetical protein
MQVIEEQEQDHWFTEDEIMPRWLNMLKAGKTCTHGEGKLCLHMSNCCMVGEAYGFSSAYFEEGNPLYCSDCHKFSRYFAMPAYTFDNDYRAKFVEHMNERHNELLEKRR